MVQRGEFGGQSSNLLLDLSGAYCTRQMDTALVSIHNEAGGSCVWILLGTGLGWCY